VVFLFISYRRFVMGIEHNYWMSGSEGFYVSADSCTSFDPSQLVEGEDAAAGVALIEGKKYRVRKSARSERLYAVLTSGEVVACLGVVEKRGQAVWEPPLGEHKRFVEADGSERSERSGVVKANVAKARSMMDEVDFE
jgi:hypothetical protein